MSNDETDSGILLMDSGRALAQVSKNLEKDYPMAAMTLAEVGCWLEDLATLLPEDGSYSPRYDNSAVLDLEAVVDTVVAQFELGAEIETGSGLEGSGLDD